MDNSTLFKEGQIVYVATEMLGGKYSLFPARVIDVYDDEIILRRKSADIGEIRMDINDRRLCLTSDECYTVCNRINENNEH